MCGITGLLGSDRQARVSPVLLDRMIDALTHRGPDDRGRMIDGSVGIGMRRLSIIDVEGGHQPMSSSDGSVTVVYNGECYNHEDLRRELEALGSRFRTRCDTEIVVHGFRQWGIRGLAERMNGIYAFCVWDGRERRAYLCRDRLGVKPLYYVHRGSRFAFSSELRSLALSGLVRAKVDEVALWGYLTYQFTPTEQTLVSGIRKLPAAHFLVWTEDDVRLERYWEFPVAGEETGADFQDGARALRSLLEDTVERQMMSDVPIGCFLSGGLDSTIVACMMAKRSSQPLRTFSIAFPGNPEHDESPYFERMAREIGARHQTIEFSERAILEALDEFSWAMDEPVADPAMLPTYLLSREAAKQVKVVLTGEGADEVFAGYPYYRPFALGTPAARAGSALARYEQWAAVGGALSGRIGRTLPAPRNDRMSAISGFPYAMDAPFLWQLLHPDRRPGLERLEDLPGRVERSAIAGLRAPSPLQAALAVDTKIWLAHNLMPKLDKMTMAHSLEGRVPFLDHRLVELAFTMPARFKVGPEHGKLVLREAVRGIVPDDMIFRVKHGFNVPLLEWFRGCLRELARQALLGPTLTDSGLFDRGVLEAMLAAHLELGVNVARPLWSLVCLSRWLERLNRELAFTEEAPSDVADPVPGASLPAGTERGRCDIVIPVYEGVGYVRDLLRSLRSHTRYPYRVILIDDSANDSTYRALEELVAGDPATRLHRNESNLGFVATCNRGLAMARAEYACILNTDTIVTAGWLEKMVRCAESDARIAIVNPVTNGAVNLSVPMPPGANLATIADTVERHTRRRYPDVTTAVGFCMLLKRRYVEWLGGFDPVYGRGYCEESDLCMRYTEAGLRVVVADDAFVYHKGCGSFGTWLDRYQVNRKIFDERWEDAYLRDYHGFLRRNPLQYLRDGLLRHTIGRPDWSPETVAAVEKSARRVNHAHLSDRGGDAPLRRAAVRAGLRTSTNGRGELARHAERLPRTRLDPEDRQVRYPTRSYVDGLSPGKGLRITFLVQEMAVCGGVTSIVQLAREMLLAGCDVKVATLHEALFPERFNLPSQPIVYPSPSELVRLFPPSDVVVATFWMTAYDYLPELRRRYDFLSVYFAQDYEVHFYPEEDHQNRARAAATYAMAEHRIVKSRWLKDLIERNHGLRCEQVHLGLDLGIFRNRKASERLGDPPRVVAVARPGELRRGFDQLVEVYRMIHEARPDVELALFGAPEASMPKDLPFPYVNHGRIEDLQKVAEVVSSADVLVDPSLFQGFGRPGIEAMACGTACVLTSEGGVNEYARNGENCLMVPPRETQAMAAGVLRLLGDDALRTRFLHSGLETARQFCHRDEARIHLDLYSRWWREKYGRPPGEWVPRKTRMEARP